MVSVYLGYLLSGRDMLGREVASGGGEPVIVADPDFAWQGPPKPEEFGAPHSECQQCRSADMDRDIKFDKLGATRAEGVFVHELLGGTLLLGQEATVSRFKSIHAPRILHVATHGFFLKDQPAACSTRLEAALSTTDNPYLRSGLALAGAQAWQDGQLESSGVITAQEIRQMHLQGTELAVLSACDTGLGEIRRGQGVLGLARAFLLSGARTVVMSLWQAA